MKKAILLILAIISMSSICYAGSVKIDRVWLDSNIDFFYVLVTYTNDTEKTFNNAVTITCFALDSKGNKLNSNHRSFFVHEYGPIKPGFTGTLKIPIELHGASAKSASCNCREW